MRLKKLNSEKEVLVKIARYKINWDGKSKSKIQFKAKQLLRPFWEHHIVLEEMTIPGSLLKFDFVNATRRIVIEISGRQHTSYLEFFMKNRHNYLQSIKRDLSKIEYCEKNNLTFLELFEEDLEKFSLNYIKEKFEIDLI